MPLGLSPEPPRELLGIPMADVRDRKPGDEPSVALVRADTIEARAIEWLWPKWLARGKLHVLAGPPGAGKTTVAMGIASIVSRGSKWPCGTPCPQGNVLVWSGEDDPADTLVPRLSASGADLSKVFFVGDVRGDGSRQSFDPALHLPQLEASILRHGGVSLVIVDPIVSAVVGDSHKNTEVRRALQPLVDIGLRLNAAFLGISHFSKGTAGRDPTERVTGSLAFAAVARVVMVACSTRTPGVSAERILARAKSNIGPDDGGFSYAIEFQTNEAIPAARVRWIEELRGSAQSLLSSVEADTEVEDADEVSAFVTDLLSDGPKLANEVFSAGRASGYSKDQLKRAKRKLGVRASKGGMAGSWSWILP